MKVLGVIPSRFASTRFPGKPLIDILGKTMIQRVYEQVSKSKLLDRVIVATDDDKIFDHVKSFGGNVIMTSNSHESGTDRCNEVASAISDYDIVVNIQGDEPLIEAEQIDKVIACFESETCNIATLIKRITNPDLLHDSSKIKVVKTLQDKALYFSRHAIPFQKMDKDQWFSHFDYWQHIGIYGYRTHVLNSISKLAPSSLEKAESLEQLRWLENGFDIVVAETEHESISIDIPEDLDPVKALIKSNNN